MSRDQMADVFPILFDWVEGEQPTAEKLTGLVKHIDIAFAGITQAIGDPWDYQGHSFNLSSENLGITNLSRIIGPSDYLSPLGGCFNEESADTSVTLALGKNSWNLGYPLIKVTADASEDATTGGSYSELTWNTDIIVTTDPGGVLTTEVASLELVNDDGDFYVDYYKGTITAYSISTVDILLTVKNLFFFGAGIPWGTHNVIPTWNETVNLCSVTWISDTPSITTWTVTFPTINKSSRVTIIGQTSGGSYTDPDAEWDRSIPGYGSYYRLPRAITSAGLTPGDAIPEGYLLLWDDINGRVVPNVLFYYLTDRTLRITTPYTSGGYLTVGTNYRILTSGTSISEAVSYLLATQRYNKHSGFRQTYNESYTTPISHDDLENLYSGDLTNDGVLDSAAFQFRKSSYSVNPHPQYIHRAGYMSSDKSGNTANAMRGYLVFAGTYDSTNGYLCNSGTSDSGNTKETYGLLFGGGSTHASWGNTRLAFEGGKTLSTWTSGEADRYIFGLMNVGAIPADSESNERYGALTITPWYGTPLYLRGYSSGYPTSSTEYLGAALGFDYGRKGETNYLKLLPAIRTGTFDVTHLAANLGQTGFSTRSFLMPQTDNRVSANQIRELRFRGVSYNSSATNTTESIGGSSTRSGFTAISEFQSYYTSPGILGADMFNVYSNAIFFSDTGDGKSTSFITHGEDWLDEAPTSYSLSGGYFSQKMPTGMYYFPYNATNPTCFAYVYSIYDSINGNSYQPLIVGDRIGLWYLSTLGGSASISSTQGHVALVSGATSYGTYSGSLPSTNSIYLRADYAVTSQATGTGYALCNVYGDGNWTISGTAGGAITTGTTLSVLSTQDISITSSIGDMTLTASSGTGSFGADVIKIYTTTSAPAGSYTDSIVIASEVNTYVTASNWAVFRGTSTTGIYVGSTSSSNNGLELRSGYAQLKTTSGSNSSTFKLSNSGTSSIDTISILEITAASNIYIRPTGGSIYLQPQGTSDTVWLDTMTSGGSITFRTNSSSKASTGIFINLGGGGSFVGNETLKIKSTGEIYAE